MKKLISIVLLAIVMNIANVICGEYVYPSGGEEFINGDTITVSWNSSDIPTPIRIDVWNLNTLSYTNIVNNLTDSTFTYILTDFADGATLRLKISSLVDASKIQYSQTYFEVTECPLYKTTSDDNVVVENSLSFFPNPTYGLINVPNSDIRKIEVFNSEGRYMKSFANVSGSFDISEFPAGQYNFIIYLNDNSILKTALVKL